MPHASRLGMRHPAVLFCPQRYLVGGILTEPFLSNLFAQNECRKRYVSLMFHAFTTPRSIKFGGSVREVDFLFLCQSLYIFPIYLNLYFLPIYKNA